MKGRKTLVMGMLNRRSMAYAIAKACHDAGATLAFSCHPESALRRVTELAAELGSDRVFSVDVQSDEEIERAVTTLGDDWGCIDGIVHAVAYSPLQAMQSDFTASVDRASFKLTNDISAYSLLGVARAARPYLSADASIVTLSFLAAERAVIFYNAMGVAKAALEAIVRCLAADLGPRGVRVNAISAGPLRTASALGFSLLDDAMAYVEREAPLRRNVRADEIGQTALFLLSNMSSAITGEVLHVDCGFHAIVPGFASFASRQDELPATGKR